MASSAIAMTTSSLPIIPLSCDFSHGSNNKLQVGGRAIPLTNVSRVNKIFGSTFGPMTSTIKSAGPSSQARRPSGVHAIVTKRSESKTETIVPDPDYRVAITLLGAATALIATDNLLPAAPIGLLGLLLLVQTSRVRFVFDNEALEVKVGASLQESGENVFVGGKNRWKYSTFTNWELWWPNFPVLVYFKETQTKPEGQVHFFPVIFRSRLYHVLTMGLKLVEF
ncbi:hypothetical protein O6H91_03G001300 [Diphasiastrum complanatum]|uniref:Uncharacterized protein n=1 Tax=Diphasiastrum complanatum TaxID=34168 RepID=A0ACC2E315_DIPCM|nr:hypothetical protein O6H91_03G001300 [Diphasiastrum complanatum]